MNSCGAYTVNPDTGEPELQGRTNGAVFGEPVKLESPLAGIIHVASIDTRLHLMHQQRMVIAAVVARQLENL